MLFNKDISKLQDINNIWVFFIFSYYSAVTSMILGLRPSISIWYYALISLAVFLGVIFFSSKKNIHLSLFFIFLVAGLFLIFTKPHLRHNFKFIYSLSAFIFAILTIYYTYYFNYLTKLMFEEKREYIKEDLSKCSYNYAFIALVINIISLIIFMQSRFFHRSEVTVNIFIFSFIFLLLGLSMFKLFQYSFALRLLALSDNKVIPATKLFLENSNYSAGFSKYIYPYLNNVDYNEVENVININDKSNIFSIEEEKEQKSIVISKLSEKIKHIKEKLGEENTEIIKLLDEIEKTVNRLDNLYEEKQIKMYYNDIDNRYIQYIDKLVSMYNINLSMPEKFNNDIQKKILESLDDMNKVLNSILESVSSYKKIEIESSIDLIKKRLMMDGFDNILKDDKKVE